MSNVKEIIMPKNKNYSTKNTDWSKITDAQNALNRAASL